MNEFFERRKDKVILDYCIYTTSMPVLSDYYMYMSIGHIIFIKVAFPTYIKLFVR